MCQIFRLGHQSATKLEMIVPCLLDKDLIGKCEGVDIIIMYQERLGKAFIGDNWQSSGQNFREWIYKQVSDETNISSFNRWEEISTKISFEQNKRIRICKE